MRSLVVDTHAFVWHLTSPERLGRKARRALGSVDSGQATGHVPAIVLIEVWLLYERGKLRFGPDKLLEQIAAHAGWQVLPLDIEQGLAFGALTGVTDPMDRLVLAAARALGASVVSADAALDDRGMLRIWD